jgi:hypothetical protein
LTVTLGFTACESGSSTPGNNNLDKYILLAEQSNASDVITVFNFLRDGSYNHYWAFDEGLKNNRFI